MTLVAVRVAVKVGESVLNTKRVMFVVIAVLTTLLTTLSLPAQAASVPGKPVAKLTSGNGRVVVSWVAPAANGSTISRYQISTRKSSYGIWQSWNYTTTSGAYRTITRSVTNGNRLQAKVRAKNAKGFGSWSTVQNTVAGLPNAPISRSVTRANRSLTVSWGAAVGNGSAITAYRVYYRSQVGTVWGAWAYATTSGSIRTRTFGSLSTGKKYQFYIRAANKWGYGPSTSTLSTGVISAPNTPTSVNGVRGITQVALSWSAPINTGGSPITSYTATAVQDGTKTCSTATLTCTIIGLTMGNSYTFTVTATNAVGTSGPSIASSLITLIGVSAISAGGEGTCAVLTTGGVKCWGNNFYGQLGNGTNTASNVPVDVNGLSAGVSAISAGGGHTCALLTIGGVKCWGANLSGALGNGTNTSSNVPVDVNGLSAGVSAISAGGEVTCALLTTGGVKCWGTNGYGALGNGTNTSSNVPVDVNGLSAGVSAISAGSSHACAVLTTGGVQCWGRNDFGTLGNGTNTASNVPVDVNGLSAGVSAISASSSHTCALLTIGGVKCWGANNYMALGNGRDIDSNVPVDVTGLSAGVSAISAGGLGTCALLTIGGAKCWGRNAYGEPGGPFNTASNVPVDVTGLSAGLSAISAGGRHKCALLTIGGAKCWGNNFYGQLGNGTNTAWLVPVDVVFGQ